MQEIVMLLEKVNAIRKFINSRVFEREIETDSALMTVMSGQSCLLLGDAGAAKTQHVQILSELLGLRLFDILMSESTKPDSIFGPTDVPALTQGIQRNKVEGYAPTAELIFFDEIFKANGVVLNPLLMLINEHLYRNGDDGVLKCPTMAVFAASNEIPTDQAMRPIYDRFLIRHNVSYMKSPRSIDNMFTNILDRKVVEKPEALTKADVDTLRRYTQMINFPKEMQEMVVKIRDQVQQSTGVIVSDRRLGKTLRVIQAHALLNRRSSVDTVDLEMLAHMFWDVPENTRKVASIVNATTGSITGDYVNYQETAEKVYEHSCATGNLDDGFNKLKEIVRITKNFSTQNGKVVHRIVYELALKLKHMRVSRKQFLINILPDERGKEWYKLAEVSAQLWTAEQLRSVGFKHRKTLGYWWIPGELKIRQEVLQKRIINKLKVVPTFHKLV